MTSAVSSAPLRRNIEVARSPHPNLPTLWRRVLIIRAHIRCRPASTFTITSHRRDVEFAVRAVVLAISGLLLLREVAKAALGVWLEDDDLRVARLQGEIHGWGMEGARVGAGGTDFVPDNQVARVGGGGEKFHCVRVRSDLVSKANSVGFGVAHGVCVSVCTASSRADDLELVGKIDWRSTNSMLACVVGHGIRYVLRGAPV